ncbi:Probable lipoprotein transmembrane [Caballeronia glathei]|uniref:Membrane protein n=1 Tax=Caballeronia glathei TaxID=60547 RepID=A0A069PRB3_9BURK|nr:membrane protein [Caballeronia glathei]CDY79582.1 Probable lipoprotein transmembrane [Caballeronia glathei]
MLNRFASFVMCTAVVAVAGCAGSQPPVEAGADQSAVIARLGPPKETYDLPGGGKRLMWPTQPMGTTTTAADIDASGKVLSVRQVLLDNEFYRAEVGKWTRDDVLVNFGRPFETSYYTRMKMQVWSYRYVENNIQHLIFSFYFDDQGILRQTQRAPDPKFDPSQRNLF